MTPNWVRATRLEEIGGIPRPELDRTILLIEDDQDIADMYALGLEQNGYPVTVAASSASLPSDVGARHLHPRAVVLNLDLSSRRGFEILSGLRHAPDTANVPVIVLANDADEFSEAYRLGATECHRKYRTTPKQLVSYVSAAIAGGPTLPPR